MMFAMAGGIVLSLGNLATQYAWAYVGLSVTEVITASITVVIGTLFFLQLLLTDFFLCFFSVLMTISVF